MQMKVFTKGDYDYLNRRMFLNGSVSVSRFDEFTHPFIHKMTQKQLSFFWRPEEVDVSKDRVDFKTLNDYEQHIFTSNLKFQTLMDSVQGRSPNLAFLPIVSIPELETWIETWSFIESAIHSYSYTYIIKNIYSDPTSVFDSINKDINIQDRSDVLCQNYDALIEKSSVENLYLCLISVYILESVRFYSSFACSFIFAETGKMEGNAKIIKLIARDEALHAKVVEYILGAFVKESKEHENIALKLKPKVIQMFEDARISEKQWARHLFRDGGLLGLNEDILFKYIDYLVDKRLYLLKLSTANPKNPIKWIEDWLGSDKVQVAPQETEITAYQTSNLDMNINYDFV